VEYVTVTEIVLLSIESILQITKQLQLARLFFVVSGLKIIGHGNPDNNLESTCILVTVYWDVMQCSSVEKYQHFGGPSCVHLKGRNRERSISFSEEVFCSIFRVLEWWWREKFVQNIRRHNLEGGNILVRVLSSDLVVRSKLCWSHGCQSTGICQV
jgi:hypothetical protein